MQNLPTADWCKEVMVEEIDGVTKQYEIACRAQFSTLTFTHDLCLDEDGPGRKVGEATLLVQVPSDRGFYGCFLLWHSDPEHCYFNQIPHRLFVMPKLITLKRAVQKIYENAERQLLPMEYTEHGAPKERGTAWMMDKGKGFCIRMTGFEDDNLLEDIDDSVWSLLRWEETGQDYIFTIHEDLDRKLLEYSFPVQ